MVTFLLVSPENEPKESQTSQTHTVDGREIQKSHHLNDSPGMMSLSPVNTKKQWVSTMVSKFSPQMVTEDDPETKPLGSTGRPLPERREIPTKTTNLPY